MYITDIFHHRATTFLSKAVIRFVVIVRAVYLQEGKTRYNTHLHLIPSWIRVDFAKAFSIH